jgi:hydrogenase maturation protein HypF
VREPWRVALAAVCDALGPDAALEGLPLFARVAAREVEVVRRMLAAGLHSPAAHGAGRAFDAAGALALGRGTVRFEAQLAVALEAAAGQVLPPYAFDVEAGEVEQLDLRATWRALAADVRARVAAGEISSRFHATLAAGGAELVRRAARRTGIRQVVLTGGCLQNARLAEGLLGELSGAFRVYLHGEVPPGDGGIALGQAVVADATLG